MLAIEVVHRLNLIAENARELSRIVARDACMAEGKTPERLEMRQKFWKAIALHAKALDGEISRETHERRAASDTEGN